MSSVFVIQNQEGQFLSRQKEWLQKTEINALYKTPHRDLAVNELFEITSRDTGVRARVVSTEATSKGLPLVADLPPLEFPKFELPADLAGSQPSAEVDAENDSQAEQANRQWEPGAAVPSPGQIDEQAQAARDPNTEQV